MKQVWKHSARNQFVGCQCLTPPICFSLRQQRNKKTGHKGVWEFFFFYHCQLTSTLLAQSGYLGSFGTSHWPVTPSRPVDEKDRQSQSDSTLPQYSSFSVEYQWDPNALTFNEALGEPSISSSISSTFFKLAILSIMKAASCPRTS